MGALTAAQRALVERTPSEKTVPAYVLRWCLENALPVQLLGAADVHVVLYEDLVREPAGEMARLAEFLGRRQPSMWGRVAPGPGRPGATLPTRPWRDDKERPPTGEQRVAGWHDAMGRGLIEEAMTMVAAFGLDRIYGDGTSPRVGASRRPPGPAQRALTHESTERCRDTVASAFDLDQLEGSEQQSVRPGSIAIDPS
jgi:hypothetical protein